MTSDTRDNISIQRLLRIQNNDARNSEFWAKASLSVLYAAAMLLKASKYGMADVLIFFNQP